MYEGEFFLDQFHGKGLYQFKNGDIYEGDWVKGKRNGSGILKDSAGKVKYQGEWSNNHPANDPAASRFLKGFINIPWGTSRADTEKTLKTRPGNYITSNLHPYNGSVYWGSGKASNGTQFAYFLGKFNDDPAYIWTYCFEEKFFLGKVIFFNAEQDILAKFAAVKKDLTERYGTPTRESGKFIDSTVYWEFQDDNFIFLKIESLGYEKKTFTFNNNHAELKELFKRPFNLSLAYGHGPVYKKLYAATAIPTKSDY
jgi:hypothetical protein